MHVLLLSDLPALTVIIILRGAEHLRFGMTEALHDDPVRVRQLRGEKAKRKC